MSNRYNFSLTTFSPSGKLGQIEHALAAVNQGVTAVGIKSKNGVVIITEKKATSALIDQTSVEKISHICSSIGMVYAGMGPDARILVAKAQKSAQKYRLVYMEDPLNVTLVKEVANVMQEYTQSGGVRPFGVSILMAGYDENGPSLYQVDPSGSYYAWKATAVGKNMINAKTFLEKRYTEDMELEDAIHTAILTIKEGFEGQLNEHSIEIGVIADHFKAPVKMLGTSPRCVFKKLSVDEVRDYLANVA